jgi:hypothetical protein
MPGGGVAKSAYRNVAHQVRKHPLPAVLVATGIAWMIIDAASEDEGQASSARGDIDDLQRAGAAKKGPRCWRRPKLSSTKLSMPQARSPRQPRRRLRPLAKPQAKRLITSRDARKMYSQGRSTAERVGYEMQQGYRSGAEQLEMAMREYPLAVAIGFAAAGALFGVLPPRTRPEDEFMGEKSDQLLNASKEKGQELLERGKAVAERAAETAMGEARQQGLTPEAATEKISEIAGKVGEIAHKVTEEAGKAAEKEKPRTRGPEEGLIPPDKGSQSRPPVQS